ncbi:MAG TPA: sugar transferase [Candidatus Erysipelatoclostridium merdavium]|uniref:Sugar transferase n=1 Tax=Candidatus Erysipelatoclostridium merdavium TaxID=2838566 RepID=A0A9D1XKW1_9FIRM|nr:sugar transferase [Candidatus Erysipelatoclostridium merdavium]
MYRKYIKRLLDFILSLIAIIILSPILLIVAILVRIKLGSPVIFKQKRPGLHERIFTLYKFRTMTDQKDEQGNLLPDEIRLTKFGKLLRSTSLDELPELFNILKGDMAIVGPRPQLVRDMVFMTNNQRKRHSVRQGLTGLAQVNGRNNITWEEKINYDLQYIDKITFINDCKIILNTILKVFKREDISTNGMETAEDLGDYLLKNQNINLIDYQIKQKEALQILKGEK